MLKNIAIIPARSGSKRIPHKNIIDFSGKPMIAWTIEAALLSKVFDRVVVSTNCSKIAAISKEFGAEVPFLRNYDFDDVTPVSLATLNYALDLQVYWNEPIINITQLMANCPLRNSCDIQSFVNKFEEKKPNFMLSCFKFGWMNPWWAFKLEDNGDHNFLFPDAIKKRSQDLDELYCPTGSIWMAKLCELEKAQSFYGQGHIFNEVSWKSAVDIDDYEDLKFALELLEVKS
jgi:CMP-N-acetylneuraminic acid synthetase